MNRIRITFFLPLLHLIFFYSQQAYGEANTAGENVPPPPPAQIQIGDPREVFVVAKPQPASPASSKKNEPKNMKEFFSMINKDLSQAGKNFNEFAKELSGKHRHSFEDPNFTPPKRPDWR